MSEQATTFEGAMARLDEIVAALGSGRLSLEASLELFAEGARLVRFCNEALGEARLRLEELFPGELPEGEKGL